MRQKKHSLDEDFNADQLEQFVDKFSAQRIASDVSSNFGSLVHRGWQVYPDSQGNAVLVMYSLRLDLPAFKAVNLDVLHEKNPDFIENKVRDLYKAGVEDKLTNSISYNLAVHNLEESGLVPGYVSELAIADETELRNINNLMGLVVQNEEDGNQRVYQFVNRLSNQTYVGIPDDGRNMYLDYYLSHLATCPAESTEVRAKSRDEMHTLGHLKTIKHAEPSHVLVEGQETLKNPILHTAEFIDDATIIETNASEGDKDFIQLIDQTSSRQRGIDSTNKVLKRRMPKSHQLIQRFKVALGDSSLGGSNFDEFFKDAVSKFSMDLGSSLLNYGVKSLDDAEKVIAQSLYTKAYKLTGQNEWIRKEDRSDPYRPHVDIKDENLKDSLLYLAVKTVQQNSESAATRAGADRVMGWLKEKYSARIDSSKQKVAELDTRKKNSNKLWHKLNIPKQQMARLVNHVKKEKLGKYQTYDYSKFGVLYRTLVYAKQGLVDLDSKATKAVLTALYPNIKEEEWGLLKY